MSGQTCYPWSDMDSIVANRLWKSHNLTVEDEALGKLNNYCRNPDDDQRGPWCFTNKDTEKMEYCSIPLCGTLERNEGRVAGVVMEWMIVDWGSGS